MLIAIYDAFLYMRPLHLPTYPASLSRSKENRNPNRILFFRI